MVLAGGAPLLLTKIAVPSARPRAVRRARLLERIPHDEMPSLLLVSAPAGSGKTTFLSTWCHELIISGATAVAWYSLDARDNDPGRFAAYLAGSLTRALGGGAPFEATSALLATRPGQDLEPVLAVLLNAVAAMPQDCLLVLDDYHVITAPEIHLAITFLLDNLPPQLHLAIGSRADPPLPLARLRARNQLVELRLEDLRFTVDEVRAFMEAAWRLAVSHEDAALIEVSTEGWAAGMQLLTLASSPESRAALGDSLSQAITRLTQNRRLVFEYLADEVFERQPADLRQFLLITSVLDQLSAPLCDAVVGDRQLAAGDGNTIPVSGSSSQLLECLERTNLFLVPLDAEHHWYRYHHLFQDFLQERLEREYPGWGNEAHRRASLWYRDMGMAPTAIDHALAGGDYALAGDLIESVALSTNASGNYAIIGSWLRRLPEDVLQQRPSLCLWAGWAAFFGGQIDRAEALIQLAEQQWQAEGNRAKLGEVWHARAHVARLHCDSPSSIGYAQQALADLPEDTPTLRGGSLLALGAGLLGTGTLRQAEETLREAERLCRSSNYLGLLMTMIYQGDLDVARGRLHAAAARYEQVLALMEDRPLWQRFEAQIRIADIHREWNQLDRACAELRQVLRDAALTGHDAYLPSGYAALARTLQACGNVDEATAMFERAFEVARRLHSDACQQEARAYQARFNLALGNREAVAQWRAEGKIALEDEQDGVSVESLTLPRVLLSERRPDQALSLLRRLQATAETRGETARVIEILLLEALTLQALHQVTEALRALERAVTCAEKGGYVRLFVDEGAACADLLRQGMGIGGWALTNGNGTARSYARRLLAICDGHDPPGGVPHSGAQLASPPDLLVPTCTRSAHGRSRFSA